MTDPIRQALEAASELRQTEDAFEKVKGVLFDEWVATGAGATAKREAIYHAYQGLITARAMLQGVVDTGQIEAAVIELHKVREGR